MSVQLWFDVLLVLLFVVWVVCGFVSYVFCFAAAGLLFSLCLGICVVDLVV